MDRNARTDEAEAEKALDFLTDSIAEPLKRGNSFTMTGLDLSILSVTIGKADRLDQCGGKFLTPL